MKNLCPDYGSQEGVTSIMFVNSGLNLISSSHDGSVRVYDIRGTSSSKIVSEMKKAHGRKFDEGAMCLAAHSHAPFFASGGADCIINIFELNTV